MFIKNVGIDLLLCSATLKTTFFKYRNGVSNIMQFIYRGYLAEYMMANEAPILMIKTKIFTFFPKELIFIYYILWSQTQLRLWYLTLPSFHMLGISLHFFHIRKSQKQSSLFLQMRSVNFQVYVLHFHEGIER